MLRVRVTAGVTSWRICSFPHSNHCRGVLSAAASASLCPVLCIRRNPLAEGGPKSTMAAVMVIVRVRVRVRNRVRDRVRDRIRVRVRVLKG